MYISYVISERIVIVLQINNLLKLEVCNLILRRNDIKTMALVLEDTAKYKNITFLQLLLFRFLLYCKILLHYMQVKI